MATMEYFPPGFTKELLTDEVDLSIVNAYCQKYTSAYYDYYHFGHFLLAAYASVPGLLTPDLLYKIWMNFYSYQWGKQTLSIHRVAVSDLLLSGLCTEIGYELYEMSDSIRFAFRKWFEDTQWNPVWKDRNFARPSDIAAFIQNYHSSDNPSIRRWGDNYKKRQDIEAVSVTNPLKAQNLLMESLEYYQKEGKQLDQFRLLNLINQHKDLSLLLATNSEAQEGFQMVASAIEYNAILANIRSAILQEDSAWLENLIHSHKDEFMRHTNENRPDPAKSIPLLLPSDLAREIKKAEHEENLSNSIKRGKINLYTSFIGINAYPTNGLNGCIKDVLNIDRLLRSFCTQQPPGSLSYHPAYWLAPHRETDLTDLVKHAIDFQDFRAWFPPTYANIKDQNHGPFAHLKQAQPGDICLLYYSGHGSYVEAPEVFWGDKSNRRNETIVCVDSRSNPEARDLIDKEMAYLIWDALSDPADPKKLKKDIHCLVIMDCCHSGSNFRDDEIDPKKIRFRNESAVKNLIKAEEYLGWKEGFFELDSEGKAKFPIAPYVHLAAARDDEKAQETYDGGLFSTCLLKQLEAGGTGRTYRDLMSSLSVEVRNRADKQNPVPFAFEDKDLDHPFLSRETVPYRATYPVNFIEGEWLMSAGKINGLTPSGAQGDNLVKISGVEPLVKVTEVRNDQSVLDHTVLESLNQDDTYEALLVHLASPKLKVGLSTGLLESTELLGNLKQAYEKEAPLFFSIDFSNPKEACDYLVRLTLEGEYVLTKNNSSIPLFKRSKDPQVFLRYVDSVGKWLSISELSNQDTRFSADDFVFTVEKIEGKPFGSNPDGVSGERVDQDGKLPDELVVRYKDNHQPAFRLSIAIRPGSNLTECHVGVLYLRSRFGIRTDFIDQAENKLFKKDSDPIYLQTKDQNRLYRTIPFVLLNGYKAFNINEITAYLKILVASDPQSLALNRFQQPDLPLDEGIPTYRGSKNTDDDENAFARDSLGNQRDWTVFTMKIRVVGPNKEKQIETSSTDFTSFELRTPEGFQAKVYAATGDDQQDKLKKNKRHKGVDSTSVLANRVAPPTHLFNGVLTDNNPFPAGLSSASDNSVQVLELRPSQDDAQFPTLQGGQKLTIIPKTKPIRQRSVDDAEEQYAESILPYGYDETTGLYFPIGYTDAESNIQIEQLPPPSDGLIQGDAPLTRGIGQSIKLYFKKVFTRKPSEALCLHWRDQQGQWHKATKAPEIQQKLVGQQQAKVVLAIHGITGDTEWMLAGLQELQAQGTPMDFILTYDYESLATPIETTANKLYKRLEEVGFGKEGFPALTVVAHSMGGLITRHLLEVDKKGAFIQHLIMLGTPNDGSEVAGLRDQVYGLITDALNVGGIMKLSIAGLAYVLNLFGANPMQALGQLIPGSPVLKVLGRSPKPPIPYSIISGNISKITEEVAAGNPFLERLVEHIKGKAVYPALSKFVFKDNHHDMAVTVDSMATIPGFDREQRIEVACDHVGYFDSGECMGVLKGLI